MSKLYKLGFIPQEGFDLSNRISNRLNRIQNLEYGINKTMNGSTPTWTYSTHIKSYPISNNAASSTTQNLNQNDASPATTFQSQTTVHYQGPESQNLPVNDNNADSSDSMSDNHTYAKSRNPKVNDINVANSKHGSNPWEDWTILHEMIDGFRSADVPSWVEESKPAVRVTDRTEWVDTDTNPTSIDPIITPDMSKHHITSSNNDKKSDKAADDSIGDFKKDDKPLELESPRNKSGDLSTTLVFMLVSLMVMAASIVGVGTGVVSGFNIQDLLAYGFTGLASAVLFETSLEDLGKMYNVKRRSGEKFLDWVRRLGSAIGCKLRDFLSSTDPATGARHKHKVKVASGVMGDPYVLENDNLEEPDNGVIEVRQLEDKTAHGITEIIDSWTNALSRVGMDSRTGDMMDRVADYWYMAVDAIDSADDLSVMVAEVVEPVSALGDVVSMCVKMRKSSRLYSEKELDDAKVMLVDAENSMIEVFRKAARRSLDATKYKAESSLGYLKAKRDGDPVIRKVNESISSEKPSADADLTRSVEDDPSGMYNTISGSASEALSESVTKDEMEAGVVASSGV